MNSVVQVHSAGLQDASAGAELEEQLHHCDLRFRRFHGANRPKDRCSNGVLGMWAGFGVGVSDVLQAEKHGLYPETI